MPSYTRAGRTFTYLREQNLHHAAKDCKKITLFFATVTKVKKLTSSAQESIAATIGSASPSVMEHHTSVSPFASVSSPVPISPLTQLPSSRPISPLASVSSLTPMPLPMKEHHTSNNIELTESTFLTATGQVSDVIIFLDITEDDDVASKPVSELKSIQTLITSVKRFISFTSFLYLNAVKEFIKLWNKYKKNPRIKAPMTKASLVASAGIGKGPYAARKIRELYHYITCFHALPPVS
jgi:hypothetical protein